MFFKKKVAFESDVSKKLISESDKFSNEPPSKCRRIEHTDDIILINNKTFERDPGKRKPM